MAGSTSDRRSELPAEWPAMRKETLERDNYRCVWPGRWSTRQCGEPATDVDHIHRGNDHRPQNRQSLCTGHHRQKTQRESLEVRLAALAKTRYPAPGKHPGLK